MARFALKDETETFAKAVIGLVVPRLARDWRNKVQAMWDDIQERGMSEITDSSKKLYMSRFRKAVRDALAEAEPNEARRERVEEGLIEIIRIDPAIIGKLKEDYQEQVKSANTDLILIPEWRHLLETFRVMLRDDDPAHRAIALMALTGRRFREVLKAGTFEPSTEKTESGKVRHRFLVDFSGQLKTGSGRGSRSEEVMRIPVLAPADDILRTIRALRMSPQGKIWASASKERLNGTFNPLFNNKLREAIGAFWPKEDTLTISSLRRFYAVAAFTAFAPRTTMAPYYARILGHSADDLTTALSYMLYCVSEDARREGQEEMNRLTMLREQRRDEARADRHGEGEDDEQDASAGEGAEALMDD